MEASNELQEIWKQQGTSMPEATKLIEKANEFKKKGLFKLLSASVALILTILIIALVWIYYDSVLISTKLGMALVILGILIYGISYLKNVPLLTKPGFDMNTQQYLEQIKTLKERQQFMQNKMLNIYFILLSIGLVLYMYEPASQMPLTMRIITYSLTIGWMLFAWFYLRPKQIKRNNTKINELLEEFERVSNQIK